MAIVENPIIGTAKNSFSTVIYQHYFNKNIIMIQKKSNNKLLINIILDVIYLNYF